MILTLQIIAGLYLSIAILLYLTMSTSMAPEDGNFVVRQLKAMGISIIWLPMLISAVVNMSSF